MMDVPISVSGFFSTYSGPTPILAIDPPTVVRKYNDLCAALPEGRHHYAIKACPVSEVLQALNKQGGYFEVASVQEIDMCLEAGAPADKILYGNPIKKLGEIKEAYKRGIRQFVFDSAMELEKLSIAAPKAKIICRIQTNGKGAVSPLSVKFGCRPNDAINWLAAAEALGLVPYGISFHTGSQQLNPESWEAPIAEAGKIFSELEKQNIKLKVLNVGGGFPVEYRSKVPHISEFGAAIKKYVGKHFASEPIIYTEPGRYMSGDAGFILSEVVLVTPDCKNKQYRWVYLDIGRYGGLVEEKIDYPVLSSKKGKNSAVILAGQTCDSNDVIYKEEWNYQLPESITYGDRVILAHTGAYTTTYSTELNGFPHLKTVCLQTTTQKEFA